MARMIVGGRVLEMTADEVVREMRNVAPEPIREHLVEVASTLFPPKQVLAQITGWERQTFTTMEAVRVLTRLGFVCRRAASRSGGMPSAWLLDGRDDPEEQEAASIERRLSAMESALAVAQEAIASLGKRVSKLEAS
jgi:hypothetical protein